MGYSKTKTIRKDALPTMKSSMKRILALILFLGKGINGDFGLYKSVDASVSKSSLRVWTRARSTRCASRRGSGKRARKVLSGINQPKPNNAGKPWLQSDDDSLLALYNAGVSVGEIAIQFARTRGAIQARLVKHGVAENSFSVPEVIPKNSLNELIKKRK